MLQVTVGALMSPWRYHTSSRGIEGGAHSTISSCHIRTSDHSAWRQGVFVNVLRLERLFAQSYLWCPNRGQRRSTYFASVCRTLSLISYLADAYAVSKCICSASMNSNSQDIPHFIDEPPPREYLPIFGLPDNRNVLYQQGSHDNTFDHQQNLNSGSRMPPYNGDQVVGAPHHPPWPGRPSCPWPHPNIHPDLNLNSVSHYLLHNADYI